MPASFRALERNETQEVQQVTGFVGGRWRSVLTVGAALAFAACEPPSAGTDEWGRPADGLLESRALQGVVEAQILRDGATLVSYLGFDDPVVRARAAFALGSLQDVAARPALLERLGDVDPRVRADAAFALGQLPDTTGTRALVDQLRVEPDDAARIQQIQAIGRAGGRGAIALLLRTDIRESEKAALALALSRVGNRGVNNALAVERIIELMSDADPIVRRNAAFYFGRSAAPAFWAPVVPRLRERLDAMDTSDAAATWLLRGLARVNDPSDTSRGIRWLSEGGDWRIRHAAADLLRDRRADGAVTVALSAALSDASPHVRLAAATGLAGRASLLSEQDHVFVATWIQEHADDIATIGALLPVRVADDPYWVIEWSDAQPDGSQAQGLALQALGVLPGLEIVEREFAAAESGGPNAVVGLTALERRIPAANSERLERIFEIARSAVVSNRPGEVQLGAILLAHPRIAPLGSRDALLEAIEASSDAGPTRTLLRALSALEDPETLPAFEAALSSSDGQAQTIAAETIGALTGTAPEYTPVPRAGLAVDWTRLAALGRHPRLVLTTEGGDVVLELDSEQAPLTVSTFIELVESGAYDGAPFHRVVPAFVAQGGDVQSGDGYGSAPVTIQSEFTRARFDRGVLGMASAGKDTEGSQFFITHLITPHLDGGYTAFGRVISGQDVVDGLVRGDRLTQIRVAAEGGP